MGNSIWLDLIICFNHFSKAILFKAISFHLVSDINSAHKINFICLE